MTQRKLRLIYILVDLFTATLAWICFYIFRKYVIERVDFTSDLNFYIGLAVVPLYWISFYAITGIYRNVYKRHRIRDFGQTVSAVLIGSTLIFFLLLLDDRITSYQDYYWLFLGLFTIHFAFTLLPRLIITSVIVKRIHSGKIGFPTLIIGGNDNALLIYNEILALRANPGYLFKGFISTNGVDRILLSTPITYYGKYDRLKKVIIDEQIEEVIIAIESSEHESLNRIINDLRDTNVAIKVIPDMYDILTGSVKMTSIFGALLIEVNRDIMPPWQQSAKRFFDLSLSIFALLLLSPFFLILSVIIKITSKGPIFFIQERIGQFGRPFFIYKFRSMRSDAEKNGPQLSKEGDLRITPIGKFMRKTRLDEIPQFINVIKGDMSLVGPRPERQYYIDLIMEKASHYTHLHKVKPGITSWGQVKYGYAENVEQMIARLKYDVLYIENMSLALDTKILIYTILTVLKGSGK